MGNFVRSSDFGCHDMIEKLVEAGYLQPSERNNPDAITNAIVRLKRQLRGSVDKAVGGDDSTAM